MKLFLMAWGILSVFFEEAPVQRYAPLDLYPNEAVEALVAIESCGNPLATGGSMRGLLQMSPIYLKDAQAIPHEAFIPHKAVHIFDSVVTRYNVRRYGEPEIAIPIFHKGGPAVLRRWRRRVRRGENPTQAASKAAKAVGIRGMDTFLRKYKAARMGRAWWCGPQWNPYRIERDQS